MRKLSIAAAAAGTLIAALLPAVAAQAAVTPAAGIPIKLGHSNKCFNVQSNSTADNAKIVQYGCSATAANDKFKLVPRGNGAYRVQSVSSGKCLNVTSNSLADNALIIQYTCSDAANNLWRVVEVPDRPTFRLVSTRSGKCLNVPGNSTADNVQLIQYTCNGSPTKLNEQVYFPPADSATPVARPFTTKQPVAAIQKGMGPVYLSWIDAANQLNVLADFDLTGTNPSAPDPVWSESDTAGYTGRPQIATLQDGRVQTLAHDATAGDIVLTDETAPRTGVFGGLQDIGGALATGPGVGRDVDGSLYLFAVRDGQLWYAPQSVNNPQTPAGAWRNLGGSLTGSNLTGTPSIMPSSIGPRVFVTTTAGLVLTAYFTGGALGDWQSLGGVGVGGGIVSSPFTVSTASAPYLVTVFARTSNGFIVYKQQDKGVTNGDFITGVGAWSTDWLTLDAPAASGTPSAAQDPVTGVVSVSFRGTDGTVYYAAETGYNTEVFGEPIRVSDPADPETLAASDPTVFTFTDATGRRPAIAFPSAAATVDFPVVLTVEGAAASAQRKAAAAPEIERQRLDAPKQPARLGS